jgi:alpha,alpha-trehalase
VRVLRIDPSRFPAFAIDLDGVVTKTAAVHAAAWKRLFDELLARRAGDRSWQPFDADREYRVYVDGKPRREGLRSFLASRGISLPEGAPGDAGELDTIHGLAARKNRYVLERLAAHGVEVFDDAVAFLRNARARGIHLAVVTASQNCAAVLAAARLTDAFDVRVDGNELARLGLRGKPAPDSFLAAARQLGMAPRQVVVLEDAIAGVKAGRAGGFGLVIGVDRTGHAEELEDAGADAVVASLDELDLGADTRAALR